MLDRKALLGEEVLGLQELITYGLKGAAAYASHAQVPGSTIFFEKKRIAASLQLALTVSCLPCPFFFNLFY